MGDTEEEEHSDDSSDLTDSREESSEGEDRPPAGKPSEKGSTGAILLSRMVAMLSVGLGSVYSDGQDDVDGNDSSEMLTSD